MTFIHLRPGRSTIGPHPKNIPLRTAGGLPRTQVGRPRKRVRFRAFVGTSSATALPALHAWLDKWQRVGTVTRPVEGWEALCSS
jgi:hypothetical protein